VSVQVANETEKSTDIPQERDFKVIPAPSAFNQNAGRCLAKVKWCVCGHRFKRDDSMYERDLSKRLDPNYPQRKIGYCPECGRPRRLCGDVAVTGKYVCRKHGGKAGRKPMQPLIEALDDEANDAIAKMMAEQDKSLDREYYTAKFLLQRALSTENTISPSLDLVERVSGLIDKLASVQEKQARLNLMIGPGEKLQQLEFTDPRVQHVLQARFRDVRTETIRGTLAKVFQALGDTGEADLIVKLFEALPQRLQEYVKTTFEVNRPVETEAEVVNNDGS
jgi:hypothetical protein